MQTIPLVDVRAEYEPLIPRLEAAFREVLEGQQFIRGRVVDVVRAAVGVPV